MRPQPLIRVTRWLGQKAEPNSGPTRTERSRRVQTDLVFGSHPASGTTFSFTMPAANVQEPHRRSTGWLRTAPLA